MIYLRENPLLEELFDTIYSPCTQPHRRPMFAGLQTIHGVYGADGECYGKQGTAILDAGFLVDHMRLRVAFVSDFGTAAVFERSLELGWRKAEAWAELHLHKIMDRQAIEAEGLTFRELK